MVDCRASERKRGYRLMAVAIRLARQGSKKNPFYRVVATHKTSPRDGKHIEQIGTFDPRRGLFVLDQPRFDHWVKNGAVASLTVSQLIKRAAKAAPKV